MEARIPSRARSVGATVGRRVHAETSETARAATSQPIDLPATPPPASRDATDPSDVPSRLRELEVDYLRDGNPVHAWKAFAMACEAKIALPDWSLTYLIESADRILKVHGEVAHGPPIEREAEHAGKALGFGSGGPGRGKGWFRQAVLLERDRALYSEVCIEINAGNKLDLAYDAVVAANVAGKGVSRSTVVRAYLRVKRLNGATDANDEGKSRVQKARGL
jgi:hypothetical protein